MRFKISLKCIARFSVENNPGTSTVSILPMIAQFINSSCIFVNEKYCILIQISLKIVPKSPIDNNPALV